MRGGAAINEPRLEKYTLLLAGEEVEMVGAHQKVPPNLISNIHQTTTTKKSIHAATNVIVVWGVCILESERI